MVFTWGELEKIIRFTQGKASYGEILGYIKTVTTLVEIYVSLSSGEGFYSLGSKWNISKDTLIGVFFRYNDCFMLIIVNLI